MKADCSPSCLFFLGVEFIAHREDPVNNNIEHNKFETNGIARATTLLRLVSNSKREKMKVSARLRYRKKWNDL